MLGCCLLLDNPHFFWLDIIVYSDSSVLKQERIKLLSHLIRMISNKSTQQHTEFHEPVGAKVFQENMMNVYFPLLQITKWYFAPFERTGI